MKTSLKEDEKNALISSLRHLKNESISVSGQKLVREYLPIEKYNGTEASEFFQKMLRYS